MHPALDILDSLERGNGCFPFRGAKENRGDYNYIDLEMHRFVTRIRSSSAPLIRSKWSRVSYPSYVSTAINGNQPSNPRVSRNSKMLCVTNLRRSISPFRIGGKKEKENESLSRFSLHFGIISLKRKKKKERKGGRLESKERGYGTGRDSHGRNGPR